MAKTFRILSIDGGGIRGIIPALILAELEYRTGKRVYELFDLIAGTSTGGILSAALTCPSQENPTSPRYKASDVVDLYEKQGRRIFSGQANIFEKLFRATYPNEGIEGVLDKFFGSVKISEALVDLLITSYEIENRLPFIFNSRRAREDKHWDFEMRQACRATSAAPTFFNPYKLRRSNPDLLAKIPDPNTGIFFEKKVPYYALVDGGVFANNPTMLAYAEAMRFRGPEFEQAVDQQIFYIVSLGTGDTHEGLKFDSVNTAASWISLRNGVPLISVFFQAGSASVAEQSHRICGHPPDKIHRIQAKIDRSNEPMDIATDANIKALKNAASQSIHHHDQELETIKNELLALLIERPAAANVQ